MTGVAQLERRMDGLRTIREIVSSLRALSSLRYRRAREALVSHRELEAELRAAVASVAAPRPLVVPPTRILVLVLGSDQGFCGALVRRLVELTVQVLEAAPPGVELVPLAAGRRTAETLEDALGRPVASVPFTAPTRSVDPIVEALATSIESRILDGEINGVEVVYARHRAPGTDEPEHTRLFPVDPRHLPGPGRPTRLQESADRVLGHLLFEWVYAELYRVVLEAQAAEHGARMRITDGATNAIEETLEALRLEHHRARQAETTAEVLEILSAAEVMLHGRP